MQAQRWKWTLKHLEKIGVAHIMGIPMMIITFEYDRRPEAIGDVVIRNAVAINPCLGEPESNPLGNCTTSQLEALAASWGDICASAHDLFEDARNASPLMVRGLDLQDHEICFVISETGKIVKVDFS